MIPRNNKDIDSFIEMNLNQPNVINSKPKLKQQQHNYQSIPQCTEK